MLGEVQGCEAPSVARATIQEEVEGGWHDGAAGLCLPEQGEELKARACPEPSHIPMDALGVHHFWGFSPALDLQQVARTVFGAAFPPLSAAAPTAAPRSLPAGLPPAAEQAAASSAPPRTGEEAEEPLVILLVQPGDPRSILKTIAQRFRHSARPLHVSC